MPPMWQSSIDQARAALNHLQKTRIKGRAVRRVQ